MPERLKKHIVPGLALLAAGLLAAPTPARVIVLGGAERASRQELRDAAALVAADVAAVAALNARGYSVRVGEGNVLSAALSPTWTGPTYVWSDGPVIFGAGFRSPSGTVFENSAAGKALGKGAVAREALPAPTALKTASLVSGRLSLGYSVSAPGVVRVRAHDLNGKTLGSWTWRETASGAYDRELALRGPHRGSLVWVRWSHGSTHVVRRILAADAP